VDHLENILGVIMILLSDVLIISFIIRGSIRSYHDTII
jgi:hypothetical protein